MVNLQDQTDQELRETTEDKLIRLNPELLTSRHCYVIFDIFSLTFKGLPSLTDFTIHWNPVTKQENTIHNKILFTQKKKCPMQSAIHCACMYSLGLSNSVSIQTCAYMSSLGTSQQCFYSLVSFFLTLKITILNQ